MLSEGQRRALELLAATQHGLTEGTLKARGFTIELLTRLVSGGLATARCETTRASGHPIEIIRITITDAGRRALQGRGLVLVGSIATVASYVAVLSTRSPVRRDRDLILRSGWPACDLSHSLRSRLFLPRSRPTMMIPSINPAGRWKVPKRLPIAFCVGIAATLAWRSHRDTVREVIASSSPQHGWLAPRAAGAQTAPAAIVQSITSADLEELQTVSFGLISVRQKLDQLSARQEQMMRDFTAKLQTVEQEILDKMSARPPQSVATPAKPVLLSLPVAHIGGSSQKPEASTVR